MEVAALSEYTNTGTGEACRGFATCGYENAQNAHCLNIAQFTVIHCPGEDAKHGPRISTGIFFRVRLRRLERDARRVLAEQPGMSALMRDGGSAEGTRLAEGVLMILRDGGFSPQDAVLCFATLFTFMTGQIDLDTMAHAVVSESLRATLEGVTRTTPFSRDELFEFGFDAVIDGLKIRASQSRGTEQRPEFSG